MPSQSEYIAQAREEEKKQRLRKQWKELCDHNTIHCGCGQLRAVSHAYRCLYCGEFFCTPCAEHHFGKTVRQYREEKAAEDATSMLDVAKAW